MRALDESGPHRWADTAADRHGNCGQVQWRRPTTREREHENTNDIRELPHRFDQNTTAIAFTRQRLVVSSVGAVAVCSNELYSLVAAVCSPAGLSGFGASCSAGSPGGAAETPAPGESVRETSPFKGSPG
jgi:hypothetical protein